MTLFVAWVAQGCRFASLLRGTIFAASNDIVVGHSGGIQAAGDILVVRAADATRVGAVALRPCCASM